MDFGRLDDVQRGIEICGKLPRGCLRMTICAYDIHTGTDKDKDSIDFRLVWPSPPAVTSPPSIFLVRYHISTSQPAIGNDHPLRVKRTLIK
jgi:hypothetical protein